MSSKREKQLRANPTMPEKCMWRLLHPFRTGGYHFRKQEQIGPFYVDFACHHAKLVIEVDGDTHFTDARLEADVTRDEFLRYEGYTVLRFTNSEVMQNEDGVYTLVAEALASTTPRLRARRPLPGPPHDGEGEEAASPPKTFNIQASL
jgi:very-short-patch-repair endonuclease